MKLSRDWAEYVYQSDMTEQLYAATTAVYEMLDVLHQNPKLPIPKELKPIIKHMRQAAGDDFKQIIEETE